MTPVKATTSRGMLQCRVQSHASLNRERASIATCLHVQTVPRDVETAETTECHDMPLHDTFVSPQTKSSVVFGFYGNIVPCISSIGSAGGVFLPCVVVGLNREN